MRAGFISTALVAMVGLTYGLADVQAAQSGAGRAPRKVKDVRPEYPPDSLLAGDESLIIVELHVDASGAVENARVLVSKCARLDESALKAVRAWRYQKLLVNGIPTPFTVTARVPFRLPDTLKSRAGSPGACRWSDRPRPVH